MASGFDNDTVFAKNVDFRGVSPVVGQFTTDGQMLFGATAAPFARVASPSVGAGIDYTAGAGTGTWSLTGGGVTLANRPLGFSNIGFTYSVDTFRVTARDGSALSATNAAQVTFQSKSTPGTSKTIAITANQGFIDDNGASQIIGNNFGTTAGVAWAQTMPFFVYGVLNSSAGSPETACTFMISRSPCATTTTGTTIANLGDNTADSQADFFALANITIGDYANSPCVVIGSFRMTKSALDDWTVTALTMQDGPGMFSESNLGNGWLFPLGQNGADASNWFSGTAVVPIITGAGSAYLYTLYRNGRVNIQMTGLSLATNGTGAGALKLHLPVWDIEGNIGSPPGFFRYLQNSVQASFYPMRNNTTDNNYVTFATLVPGSAGAAGDVLQCSSVTSGVNAITNLGANFTYQGFHE